MMSKLLLVLSLLVGTSAYAQQTTTAKPTYALIPPSDVVLAVASQPDSPLRLDNSRLLWNLASRQMEYDFDLRNEGKKPISHVVIEVWRLNGTGGTLGSDWNDKRQLLLPGQSYRSDEYKDSTFVPYTKEMRESFKIGTRTRMLFLLVVREVWYSDGTKYDANKDVEMIRALFDKLGDTSEILN